MSFVPWKDRVTSTPHRYKLTEVSADTYDLEAVPGSISEAGTPVNAEHLDRLIQRDGDDIKDTVVAFTEASSRANIATGESTATLFGKIKKYFTDLKIHAFANPSTTQGTGTTTVPCDLLLKNSSFARVYREAEEISGITYPVSITDLLTKIIADGLLNCYFEIGMDSATETKVTGLPVVGTAIQTFGTLTIITPSTSALRMRVEYSKEQGNGTALIWLGSLIRSGAAVTSVTWKQIIDDSTAQTISAVKTYTASPIVPTTPSGPSAAVAKSYVDGLSTPYSKVIRNQTEFEALIASATWLGAESVALVGQFTLSTANNSGIKIPVTVKQIHGFNSAKITITNFVYNSSTAKGGLWYYTLPTTNDYSIRDLEVDCTGAGNASGFVDCTNLTNCTGTGTGAGAGYGFLSCTNLTNCTGTGTGTGSAGCGFGECTNLTNCTGTGTGAPGYGFSYINYASNCSAGVSSTNMWGGTNTNIDLDTCCRTPQPADNTTLNA